MKKYFNLIFLFLAVFVTSCDLYEDAPEKSTIASFKQYGVGGLPTDITVNEKDTTLNFNFTLNQDQISDVTVLVGPTTGSTATENTDYALSTHGVDVQAYGGGGTFSVAIKADLVAEADEKIVLSIKGASPLNLPTEHKMTITIKNRVLPATMTLDWQGNFTLGGQTYTLCANADIDLYVINASGADATGYAGATAACPEVISAAKMSALAAGTYELYADLWSNGLNGANLGSVKMPLRFKLFRPGSFEEVNINTASGGYTVWDGNSVGTEDAPGIPGVPSILLGTLEVAGKTFTLKSPTGTVLGSVTNP